jgi:hypothetical protein
MADIGFLKRNLFNAKALLEVCYFAKHVLAPTLFVFSCLLFRRTCPSNYNGYIVNNCEADKYLCLMASTAFYGLARGGECLLSNLSNRLEVRVSQFAGPSEIGVVIAGLSEMQRRIVNNDTCKLTATIKTPQAKNNWWW